MFFFVVLAKGGLDERKVTKAVVLVCYLWFVVWKGGTRGKAKQSKATQFPVTGGRFAVSFEKRSKCSTKSKTNVEDNFACFIVSFYEIVVFIFCMGVR